MVQTLAPKPAGTWAYLKEAFTFRWNLLALGGGVAAALLSPWPDVALPLIGAVELAYLASLTGLPKFRAAIDAKAHAERVAQQEASGTKSQTRSLESMLEGLAPPARRRFNQLRQRCLDMRNLAQGVSGGTIRSGNDLRTPALDQLLWIFLRLLYSQQALQRFLAATDEKEIQARLRDAEAKLESAKQEADERMITSLTASIANTQMRLDNYRKAEKNADFVGVELDRVEGQIQALTEMSVSNQDPDFLTRQVSSVAQELGGMEATIRELNQLTGLAETLESPPSILEAELA